MNSNTDMPSRPSPPSLQNPNAIEIRVLGFSPKFFSPPIPSSSSTPRCRCLHHHHYCRTCYPERPFMHQDIIGARCRQAPEALHCFDLATGRHHCPHPPVSTPKRSPSHPLPIAYLRHRRNVTVCRNHWDSSATTSPLSTSPPPRALAQPLRMRVTHVSLLSALSQSYACQIQTLNQIQPLTCGSCLSVYCSVDP